MEITFRLNGETVRLADPDPTETLLDWLRERRGLTGTKEGCNEGDCGACTVMVGDETGPKPLNACILFLPQLHGKSVTTVEGLASGTTLHPVQQAMIEEHGSQCGFCTPGIVMSLATAHAVGDTAHEDVLAGNLCRCTGYAPILRAARKAATHDAPEGFAATYQPLETPDAGDDAQRPTTSDALAAAYGAMPDATLIAGATDVGLWVTKQLRDLDQVIFLGGVRDLKGISETETHLDIGAMTPVADMIAAVAQYAPDLAELYRRFASQQIRAAATVGGNIANGSPIGDSPPPLIAAGASVTLRKGDARRTLPLEDFFIAYGKQDRTPGEFVERVTVPKDGLATLKVYKLSKRFDQDISAVCGAFNILRDGDTITSARIAFGGMAGTPHRAAGAEAALTGANWSQASLDAACAALAEDYSPMSDMRASARYRMDAAQAMLRRAWAAYEGRGASVLEVQP